MTLLRSSVLLAGAASGLELRAFAARFTGYRSRAFSLPFINLAQVVAALRKHILALYKLDSAVLRVAPFLAPFAGLRVIEINKNC